MFFSRVRIEPTNISQLNLLKIFQGNIYATHQLIWKLFPDKSQDKRDFLFRQEIEKEQIPYSETCKGLPLFYVVSSSKPVSIDGLMSVEVKEYSPKLEIGTQLGFDVRVNPIVARKATGKKNSSKHDIIMDAKYQAKAEGIVDHAVIETKMHNAIVQWFIWKGNSHGFQLEEETIELSACRNHLLNKKGKEKIKFNSADVSGILTVTNVEKFKEILFKGIGHSKSFGCGLMMVRKVIRDSSGI